MAADGDRALLDVFRYFPDGEEEPRFQRYEVPFREEWVVLDALNYIKDQVDGSLTFRWSCRMGVCGSCGMMVNGEPKLTCAAFLKDYHPDPIRVEPLANFPVVRDLVVNQDDFMEKLRDVKAWLIPKEEKSIDDGEYLQTPAELARYKQYSMCINCQPMCAQPGPGRHASTFRASGVAAIASSVARVRPRLNSQTCCITGMTLIAFLHVGSTSIEFDTFLRVRRIDATMFAPRGRDYNPAVLPRSRGARRRSSA